MSEALIETVDSYLAELQGEARTVAVGEWGLTVESAGWPLDVGIAQRDGLLRIQAPLAASGEIPGEDLLWWNRRIPLVRFATTRSGEVWICCDLLPESVTRRNLDRVLGLVVLAATQARETIRERRPGD